MYRPNPATLPRMTLEYRSANFKPPCQRGLTVWGVLFLLAAGVVGLGVVFGLFAVMLTFSRLTTLAAATTTSPATAPANTPVAAVTPPPIDLDAVMFNMVIGLLFYTFLAIVLATLGVGMVRKRRWVRPWILAGSFYLALVILAATPITVLALSYSEIASLEILLPIIALAAIGIGLSLMIFRYFRKPEMIETLNHFDPTPSRLDRWPVPVFSVAVIAVISGIVGLFSLWTPIKGLTGTPSPGGLLIVLSNGLASTLYIVGGVYCLVRPRLGWQILMTSVVMGSVLAVIITLFFRDSQIHAMQLSGLTAVDQTLPPTWVFLISVTFMLLAYAISLWIIRKPFLSPEPEIPLAQLAPQN